MLSPPPELAGSVDLVLIGDHEDRVFRLAADDGHVTISEQPEGPADAVVTGTEESWISALGPGRRDRLAARSRASAGSPRRCSSEFTAAANGRARSARRVSLRLERVEDVRAAVGGPLLALGHAELLEHVARGQVRRLDLRDHPRGVQHGEGALDQRAAQLRRVAATPGVARERVAELEVRPPARPAGAGRRRPAARRSARSVTARKE